MDLIASKINQYGQQHLLTFYQELNSEDQKQLLDTLSGLDYSKLHSIFNKATCAVNDQNVKLEPFPQSAFDSTRTASIEALNQWYNDGLKLISENKVAVILLAGGQGTRLGSADPKGCFDIGLPSKSSLFELQGKRLLKLQKVIFI